MARTKNNIVKDAVISITNLDITDLLNRGLNKNIFSHNNNGLKGIGTWWKVNTKAIFLQLAPSQIGNTNGRWMKDNNGKFIQFTSTNYSNDVFLLTSQWGDSSSAYDALKKLLDLINPNVISQADWEFLKTPMKSSKGSSNAVTGSDKTSLPLNLILYGPPGTGKTYNSIFMALDMLGIPADDTGNRWFGNDKADRGRAVELFNRYKFNRDKGKGCVVFTTFHQAISYEDFIEGIKPVLPKDQHSPLSLTAVHTGSITGQTEIKDLPMMTYEPKDGLFKEFCNSDSYIITEDDIKYFVIKNDEANENLNEKENPSLERTAAETFNGIAVGVELPKVIIIDEINRGNVANIFGELITLIEEDKRVGYDNELTVTLPYSGEEFGVPNNLYILGTMNTADRSVEALDSALRRRFTFEEMMPKTELLSKTVISGFTSKVTLKDLLDTINERIEVLKDREHQIGHSYLMKFVGQKTISPDELQDVFQRNIIPLLQEYFYGDYQKIRLVLGDGFVSKKTQKVIFAVNDSDDIFDDNPATYIINRNVESMADALAKLLGKELGPNDKDESEEDNSDDDNEQGAGES